MTYSPKKINYAFLPLLRFAASTFRYDWLRNIQKYFYKYENIGQDAHVRNTGLPKTFNQGHRAHRTSKRTDDVYNGTDLLYALLGAAQPIYDFRKGITDFVQPYKSKFHIKRDALQPLNGLKNIAAGILTVIAAPIVALAAAMHTLTKKRYWGEGRILEKLKQLPIFFAGWLAHSAALVTKGVFQLVTTPITWLFKMPIRSILTKKHGRYKNLSENTGVKGLLSQYDAIQSEEGFERLYKERDIIADLHKKAVRALDRGQNTSFTSKREEEKMFEDCIDSGRCHFALAGSQIIK